MSRERPKIVREDGGWFLAVPLSEMMDRMDDDERRALLGYALLNGEFLRVLCAHIAAPDTELADPPAHDGWLSSEDVRSAREALLPLLGDAVADELRRAREESDSCRAGRDHARSLVLVHHMYMRDGSREGQMAECWRAAIKWYNKENGRLRMEPLS